MIKFIDPNGNKDMSFASLVPQLRNGDIDRGWATKRASDMKMTVTFDGFKPKDQHALIHLIAMGASEMFGANRNADVFYEDAKEKLKFVDPNWKSVVCADGKVHSHEDSFCDHTDQGLLDTHQSFVEHGHVFKDHKHRPDKGDKIYGDILASAYNRPMHRVELLIQVPKNEWRAELEEFDRGGDIPFSMATKIKHDICSYCGHGARTTKQYCPHLKNMLGALLDDGHVVSAINDGMKFFDISRVIRPADRTAYALMKAASSLNAVSSAQVASELIEDGMLRVPEWAKGDELVIPAGKSAGWAKYAAAIAQDDLQFKAASLSDYAMSALAAAGQPAQTLTCLADRGIILPLDGYLAVMTSSTKVAHAVASSVRATGISAFDSVVAPDTNDNPILSAYQRPTMSTKLAAALPELARDYRATDRSTVTRAMANPLESRTKSAAAADQNVNSVVEKYEAYVLGAIDRMGPENVATSAVRAVTHS